MKGINNYIQEALKIKTGAGIGTLVHQLIGAMKKNNTNNLNFYDNELLYNLIDDNKHKGYLIHTIVYSKLKNSFTLYYMRNNMQGNDDVKEEINGNDLENYLGKNILINIIDFIS